LAIANLSTVSGAIRSASARGTVAFAAALRVAAKLIADGGTLDWPWEIAVVPSGAATCASWLASAVLAVGLIDSSAAAVVSAAAVAIGAGGGGGAGVVAGAASIARIATRSVGLARG
jgi:hypothetical protein